MLISVFVTLLKPWPLKIIVDYILTDKQLPHYIAWSTNLPGGSSDLPLLGWFAIGTVLIFLAGQAIGITQGYVSTGVGSRMVYGLGERLFYQIQRLSLRYHGKQKTGDLLNRVTTDSSCVQELIMGGIFPALTSFTTLAMMFFVMWKLDHALSLLAITVSVPLGLLVRFFSRPMVEHSYRYQQLEGERMALSEQTLTALPVVQAFGREDYEAGRFRNLSHTTLKAYSRYILSQIKFSMSVSTVTSIGTAIIITIGGLSVLHASMTVGSLLVFLSYLTSLYAPLETLANITSSYASASAKARRVIQVMELEDDVTDTPRTSIATTKILDYKGRVVFKNVTFGYDPGRPVLKKINLDIDHGETIAIVGRTGAGKSTLVSLIPRFYDPWEGQVLFDGVDLREIRLASLRSNVSILLQDPFILPLSVSENISYGRPGASSEDIVSAAVAARADEFIRNLPNGYESVIGERGATLSGGEKQRIAIARAILKDAPVLILDEPASALDAQKEKYLIEALEFLMKERTTFIISHRLSTISFADRIIVLEEGMIVETGTEQELLGKGGTYKRVHDLYFDSILAKAMP